MGLYPDSVSLILDSFKGNPINCPERTVFDHGNAGNRLKPVGAAGCVLNLIRAHILETGKSCRVLVWI